MLNSCTVIVLVYSSIIVRTICFLKENTLKRTSIHLKCLKLWQDVILNELAIIKKWWNHSGPI